MNNTLKSLTFGKLSSHILGLVLIIISILLIIYHYQIIICPFPLEYLEGTMLSCTDIFLKGHSPYEISYQPNYNSAYGILFNLLAVPLAKIFGNSFLIHRSIIGLSLFGSLWMVYLVLKKYGSNELLMFSFILLFYTSLLWYVSPIARPDTLGLFLFLVALGLPHLKDYSYKSIIIGVICGVLSFHTKQYFLITLVYLGSYIFIFISKRKGIFAISLSIFLWLLSIFILHKTYDYFILSTFVQIYNKTFDVIHLLNQLKTFLYLFSGLFIISLFLILRSILSNRKIKIKELINYKNIDLLHFSDPFYSTPISSLDYYFIFSIIIFLGKLGGYTGNYMVYMYQLVLPFFIFILYRTILKHNARIQQMSVLLVITCIATFFFIYNPKINFNNSMRNDENWAKLDTIVRNNTVLNSPLVVDLLLKYDKPMYDNGHSIMFVSICNRIKRRSVANNANYNIKYPIIDRMWEQSEKYSADIRNKVENKMFDVIIEDIRFWMVPKDILSEYYSVNDSMTMSLPTSYAEWNINIWIPK